MNFRIRLFCCFFFLSAVVCGFQQVETEHFVVVFDQPQAYWANKVIEAAEDVWDDLIAAYDIRGQYQKVYIYVIDPGDFPGGFTYPTRNRVTIYTTQLELNIRSTDGWVRNVVTHELAHVFSIKAANKDFMFDNFTVSSYSLYRNPDWSASFQYSNLVAPAWWIEGVAQYEAYKNGSDRWDTHRDMFLRMAALEDDLLSYREMSDFDNRGGFYPEMVYNQGFSMMLFLDSLYGEKRVRQIAASKSFFHFNESLLKAAGLTGPKLYNQWKTHLRKKYQHTADSITPSLREGTKVFDGGFWDFFGTRSPDGRYIALVSNMGYDVLSPRLYLLDTRTNALERVHTRRLVPVRHAPAPPPLPGRSSLPSILTRGVSPTQLASAGGAGIPAADEAGRIPTVYSRIAWFADSRRLCYSRWTEGSEVRDVYVFNLDTRTEHQVTWHARAKDPAPSPDGTTIAYIQNTGGMQNLALVGADGKNTRFLTNFNNGTQLYSPCWTPDGKKIIIGIMHGENRDIAIVDAAAEPFDRGRKQTDSTFFPDSLNFQRDLNLMLLVHTKADERDPCISADGAYLYFSSDRTGIFNIYRMDLRTWTVEQVTNVVGGAFAPSIDRANARLLYTGFHAANYSLYELDMTRTDSVQLVFERRDFSRRFTTPFLFDAKPGNGQYTEEKYKPRFTIWHFGPFLSLAPAFVTDTVGLSQFHTGFNIYAGELYGMANMGGSVYIAKHFDNSAGPSWGSQAVVALENPEVFGENRTFAPKLLVHAARAVVRDEETFEPTYGDDLYRYIPSEYSVFIPPDTLVAVYADETSGRFYSERVFTHYGATGSISINSRNTAALSYERYRDYYNADVHGLVRRWQARAYTIPNGRRYDFPVYDITDDVQNDGRQSLLDTLLDNYNGAEPSTDMLELYDHFNLYRDHRLTGSYRFSRIEPSFSIPMNASLFSVSTELINASYNVGIHAGQFGEDDQPGGGAALYGYGADGGQAPLYSPVEKQQDYMRVELMGFERFPFPGNSVLSRLPRPFTLRHFATATLMAGSLNRALPVNGSVYPLQYRISHFLKGYPYSFDPYDPAMRRLYFKVLNTRNGPLDSANVDSIAFVTMVDATQGDIMWGNSVAYYAVEYSIELLRGAAIGPLGMLFKGLYVTPFFEAAAVWNAHWRDFELKRFVPLRAVDGEVVWRRGFLRDAGLRLELPLTFLDTWNAFLAFTWARRLDLDDAILEVKADGTLVGLPKNRFSFAVHVW